MSDRQEKLVRELFNAIQASQGYFFFSDGECQPTTAEFFERVRGRLKWGREAVRIMRDFLAKHGELKPPQRHRQGRR